jgi:hypothetical protein
LITIRIGAASLVAAAVLVAVFLGLYRFTNFILPHGASTTDVTARERVVMTTEGGELGVARIKSYEDFERSDRKEWMNIDLGTTESEIRVAALFRYVIPLAKEWPIDCDKEMCVVHSPAVQASPPAAIYTQESRKRTQSGWARFNKEANLFELEKDLTTRLDERARTPRNLSAAQAAARPAVEAFVRTWALKHRPGSFPSRIVVLFPGESVEGLRRSGAEAQ